MMTFESCIAPACEPLESRRLLAGEPWGAFPHLIGQDAAAVHYPNINGAGMTIAVIDSGVDYMHPVLGQGFGPGYKVIAGWDFVTNTPDPAIKDDNPHGTGVSGVLAADPYYNGGQYFQGIAPQAKLVVLRAESSDQIKQALQWVMANRAQYNIAAVNLTDFLGAGFQPTVYASEISQLASQGMFIASPAGNDAPNPVGYPGAYNGVYAVGGMDQSGAITDFTDAGPLLDALGPALNVTIPYYDYATNTHFITGYAVGTSWAAPHVTGTAALLKQVDPSLTPDQIMSIIRDSGTPVYDSVTGLVYPRLNVDAAITMAYARLNGAQPTPFASTPANATDVIQAENYNNGGEGIAYHDSTYYNATSLYRTQGVDLESATDTGGGYDVGWFQPGEWMTYTVNVPATGTYRFDARAASQGQGGTVQLLMDNNPVSGSIGIPDTGGWQNWQTIGQDGINLTAGTHVLKILATSAGATGFTGNLNWFQFVPTQVQPPPPPSSTPYNGIPAPAPGTIQAENFDNGGESVAYHDTETANLGGVYRNTGVDLQATTDTGGGYNVGWGKAGEWMKYTINVASTGTYSLASRLAAVGSGGTFHIEVDGVNVTGAMNIPNTGNWQTWQTATKGNVNLTAGTHVLRFVFDRNGASGYGGNLNWIKLTNTTPPASTPFSGTPIALPGVVQVENFDNGGQGVAYNDTETTNYGGQYRSTGVDIQSTADTGGGYNLGWTKAGEWLNYTVNVPTAGVFNFNARVASSGAGGNFHLLVDGVDVTGQLNISNTGGWQNWQTVSKTGVALAAGQHVMRLVFDTNGASGYVGNFNWFSFT